MEQINLELSQLGEIDSWGTKREISLLPEILTDEENIRYLTSGIMNNKTWLAVCTNYRVLFIDKGMFFGFNQVEVPIERINSISYKTGLVFGQIEIWDGASKMMIEQCMKQTVKPFTDAVNIEIRRCKKTTENITVSKLDTADQIRKLANLLQDGILTKEEFDEQKKKVLNIH